MTEEQILQDVDKTSIQLMLKETFYGHFFTNLIKDVTIGDHPVQTAAISLNPTTNTLSLLINDKFWTEELKGSSPEESKQFKYGIIKHEILHILFKHIFNYNKFSDKTIANIAVDLVVNQYILLEQLPMKDKICLLQNFPDFFPKVNFDGNGNVSGGDDANQTSEYYYRVLMKQAEEIGQKLGNSSSGQGQPQSGSGQSQSGTGDPGEDGEGDGEDEQEGQGGGMEDHPNWDQLNKSQKQLAKFIGNKQNQQMHSTWKELSEMKKGKKDFVESWVDQTVAEAVKKADRSNSSKNWRGNMPAGLLDYLDKLVDSLTPSANWKKVLREFAQNGERTYHEPTLKRRSKRYNTFPGHKIKTESKILIAIDTSGSVCNASLAEFFAEVYHIYKTDAEIRIVECDYNIGKIWDYKGVHPDTITGRGGTSFDEPIIYANEVYKPDALVYFTDGEAPAPPKCNCPMIWIISKNQGVQVEDIEDFQGIKIKMDF
jgi:predicted metal-dependent peptidase